MTIGAVLDSCVLFGMPVCDTLLRAAESQLYRLILSDRIVDDATRNMVNKGRLRADRADFYKQQLQVSFPDAFVTVSPDLIEKMTNAPEDRHVAATAITGSAKYIVTFNLKDFTNTALAPDAILAIHPDCFLELLCDIWGDARLYQLIYEQSQALKNPPISIEEILAKLVRQRCNRFHARLLAHIFSPNLMPEFQYLPSVPILQALVKGSLVDNLDNINKAVRLRYTLRELVSEFQSRKFTDGEWRKHLYKSPSNSRDLKPPAVDECISTKSIKEILFDRQPQEIWQQWRESFINYYLNSNNRTRADLENYLNFLELEKPFYVTGKTILNDLKNLVNQGYLEKFDDRFQLAERFPNLQIPQVSSAIELDIDNLIQPEITADLPGDFRSFTDLFWQQQHDIQRFYLHADYQIPYDAEVRIAEYRRKLREIWKNGSGVPCRLTYQSSSQKQIYSAVIYPVCIYYYQRSFYLCAFGRKEDKREIESNWYNYRLDRIQALEYLDWEDESIPLDLIEKCRDIDDNELIYDIENGVEEAYGFDIEQPIQLMLMRFDRDFHDRYIKNTWRHNTFKLVDPNKINGLLNKSGLNTSDRSLIETRIKSYPQDAYYTMNYRVGDNSVIMRLRAWCPNVEVLFPLDLRQRMRDDMKKTWELYREDE